MRRSHRNEGLTQPRGRLRPEIAHSHSSHRRYGSRTLAARRYDVNLAQALPFRGFRVRADRCTTDESFIRLPRPGEQLRPMIAARTLYEYGRLKNGGVPFRECEIPDLWNHSRNGTYAILATRLLRADSSLNKNSLWREIQRAVRREVGEEPADSNQGGPTLTFQLWHLGLIKDESA